jgi:hypothetical protein
MRKIYVFLCTQQPEREFPVQRFLQATRSSLKLFPLRRKDFGVLELSFLGILSGFMVPFFLLLTLLVPGSLNVYWILAPAFIIWSVKAWQWAVKAAFRYSEWQSPVGLELQMRKVKFGLVNHKLQVEAGGRETLLIVNCRHRTLTDALQLAAIAK